MCRDEEIKRASQRLISAHVLNGEWRVPTDAAKCGSHEMLWEHAYTCCSAWLTCTVFFLADCDGTILFSNQHSRALVKYFVRWLVHIIIRNKAKKKQHHNDRNEFRLVSSWNGCKFCVGNLHSLTFGLMSFCWFSCKFDACVFRIDDEIRRVRWRCVLWFDPLSPGCWTCAPFIFHMTAFLIRATLAAADSQAIKHKTFCKTRSREKLW